MTTAIDILSKERDSLTIKIGNLVSELKDARQKLKDIEDGIVVLGGNKSTSAPPVSTNQKGTKAIIMGVLPPLGTKGITSQEIADFLKMMGSETAKTTIASTLTRLRHDTKAVNIDGKWFSSKAESPNNVGPSKEFDNIDVLS